MFEAVSGDAGICERIARSFDHQLSPYDALPLHVMLGVLGRALLRGHLSVFSEFKRRADRRREVLRELSTRQRLLDQVTT